MRSAGDTICAVATGVGGGIGVVRISGPDAERIVRRLIPRLPEELPSHRLHLGRVELPVTGEVLDEVLAVLMRGPHSYTGEDVAELQGHGGEANLHRLLAAVRGCGARLAEPGEFTRRAFLAGRIDLTRAEAVAEVIAARSERAVRLAQAHLRGSVATAVGQLRERVLNALAEVEASVDFPDERLDFAAPAALAVAVAEAAGQARTLGAGQRRGRLIAEGIDVALVGRANAGKSSLLNALAGEERALVDAEPGTTRDYLEVELDLGGLRATVVDTAGEREVGHGLERRGLELGRRRRERADVVVLVVDGERGFGEPELALLGTARGGAALGAQVVVAWNKVDRAPEPQGLPAGLTVVATSATSGAGVSQLVAAVRAAAGDVGADELAVVSSERQAVLLNEAAEGLERAAAGLGASAPPELVAVDLRVALARLGEITGETFDAQVLDRLFARFCIGK